MMTSNSSVAVQYLGELERIMVSVFTGVPCFMLLTINIIILFTLRSKLVFRETSRYILLTNLLIADTLYMMISQIMYILANSRVFFSYPVCGLLILYAMLTESIFALTLAVMSLERYVAVCYPLQHSNIVTVRSTAVSILIVWTFSFVNVLIRIVLMCQFPFEELESLDMKRVCDTFAVVLTPVAAQYDRGYNIFLFSFVGFIIIMSLTSVSVAARSASTDKKSFRKVQKTLLLHMIQLLLGLSFTIYIPVFVTLFQVMSWIGFVRMMVVMYVFVFFLPRSLSPLIYGLRDQTIRPILLSYLCCGLKPAVKTKILP